MCLAGCFLSPKMAPKARGFPSEAAIASQSVWFSLISVFSLSVGGPMQSLHPLLVAERKSVTERASVRAAQPSRLCKRGGDRLTVGLVFAHLSVLALYR